MNSLFYAKMAVSNIRKNKKIFFPYIIMGIFSVMMYYMMVSLMNNDGIRKMPYSDNILALLPIGLWVARIFIVVFLFYINSFLMKQRLKEIGLYNILGMEKRHIAVMMFFENVFVFITVFVSGMILGMVFSKLMFLILMKMIAVSSVPKFQMEMTSVFMTGGYFLAIYFVTFLYNLCKIHLSNPVELLHGTEAGEKEPKTKILMTLIGLCCIGFGYYFALTTKSPMAAMNTFFIAVILVVIGTYALFTAGSIALLKLMRKNKHFYYRTGHFFSISGMIYRMKQNAAGLANICILSTMVLISISTTVSLYAGIQTTIAARSPKEIDVTANLSDYEDTAAVDEEIAKINEAHQVTVKDYTAVHSMGMITAYGGDGKYTLADGKGLVIADEKQGVYMEVISLDEYNTVCHTGETLKDGEVLLYTQNKELKGQTSMQMQIGTAVNDYQIASYFPEPEMDFGLQAYSGAVKCLLVVVPGKEDVQKWRQQALEAGNMQNLQYCVQYNTNLSKQESQKLTEDLYRIDIESAYVEAENRYEMAEQLYQIYGGLLFVGLFIGILFLMATALIIYYKQISEGYQDKKRFEIMQNVGMSLTEVKKTIRSQVLMVFFLLLVAAGIHIAVSFRIIQMMVRMLAMGETKLFGMCTLITLGIFCVIYGLVYAFTAKSYYNIVRVKA